ncbi:MAG: hypothetical protein KDI17_06885 [Halioglobus sp.]|nr:hypothetical protein [Halioglobus sp.]
MKTGEALQCLAVIAASWWLAGFAHAAVDSDAADDSRVGERAKSVGQHRGGCIDLNEGCSALMVNYTGNSVQFSLFRRDSSPVNAQVPDLVVSAQPGDAPFPAVSSAEGEGVAADSDEESLVIDFLQGFEARDDTAGDETEFAGYDEVTAEISAFHTWSSAAAASLSADQSQPGSDGPVMAGQTGGRWTTFWDFRSVYQWEVEEDVMDDGAYDVSQVALSNIYLSPKVSSSSDPEIVVCELNDPDNCRPLSD